ncbi:MAG TPA: hypothetical protein PKL83_05415, partial [bacterium]|nr:hypothetical protein [bacterium]
IGVVSTKPGLTLGAHGPNAEKYPNAKMMPVALAGRVPVKVSTLGGDIQPGDAITASSIPGVGMKAFEPGVVVGRALEAFTAQDIIATQVVDGQEVGIGTVTVFVNVGYYVPPTYGLTASTLTYGGTGYAPAQTTTSSEAKALDGLFDQDATFSKSLMVFGTSYLNDVNIDGKLTVGEMVIRDNEIDVLEGNLVLQGTGGSTIFGNNRVVIDELGNIQAQGMVKASSFAGTDESRGTVKMGAGESTYRVSRTWKEQPNHIQVTPTYETNVWVTDLSADGFVIHVSRPAAGGQEVYWDAMW